MAIGRGWVLDAIRKVHYILSGAFKAGVRWCWVAANPTRPRRHAHPVDIAIAGYTGHPGQRHLRRRIDRSDNRRDLLDQVAVDPGPLGHVLDDFPAEFGELVIDLPIVNRSRRRSTMNRTQFLYPANAAGVTGAGVNSTGKRRM